MRVYVSPRQAAHDPRNFLVAGRPRANPDVPARIERLLSGIADQGHTILDPPDSGEHYIRRVHTPEYVDFLRTAHERWSANPNAGPEVVPNVHPRRSDGPYPQSVVGQAGYHLSDLACPIGPGTWDAVLWNAHSATAAALAVRHGAEREAYALCRPPGHHSGPDYAGGFCYLNNAAAAAEILRDRWSRVAVLDIDVHHGNGTQDIFAEREDVLFVSLHGDPADYYPFFWGYADEIGRGAGEGATANFPLPRGTGDDEYCRTLDLALDRIRAYGPGALVLSLGLDAFVNDPLAWLGVTTAGFSRIAAKVSALGLPTVLVQEGGYMCDDLGRNLAAFLGSFEAGRATMPGDAVNV
jgi:acetoin utilization deacetylase AcuC-like enzyme